MSRRDDIYGARTVTVGRDMLRYSQLDLVDHVWHNDGERPRQLLPNEVDVVRVVVSLVAENVADLEKLPCVVAGRSDLRTYRAGNCGDLRPPYSR